MVKYENLNDKEICEIIIKELENFKKLISGYEKLLEAIGDL